MSTVDDSPIIQISRMQTSPEEPSDGERYVKEIRRHKWIGALLAGVLGTGGAVGGSVTAANRSEVNQAEVANLKEATRLLGPRVEKTESDIALIESNVSLIKTSQDDMALGIEELKQVNVKRLEKELAAKEKELAAKEREIIRLRNRGH